jgi:hypothetical protein
MNVAGIKEKQSFRFKVLKAAYETSHGDVTKWLTGASMLAALNLTDADAPALKEAANYLDAEGLIKIEKRIGGGLPALFRITHAGLVEMEAALAAPEKQTEHFMPMNVLFVEQMHNSVIQQGTINSKQNVTISAGGLAELGKFVLELEAQLLQLKEQSVDLDEIRAEVATLKAQIASPKPKPSIIRESLTSLRHIGEHAAGVVMGYSLHQRAEVILRLLFP